MSYQVLARKWRPRIFSEVVGQEHVLQALINALDNDRLHHAYLFAGTRGVGKTTLARILAKCLNCEQGVSSVPCGECGSCREIADGRFVDLIEVDAASRTKVEDTREMLENVQYSPTRGRYKVYLIDEVHMLSGHSFNALLKTLEEPPPHVKFLLATTEPQKLPVTILSRCLQFNLKHLGPERIVGYLRSVLESEQIPHEEPALWALGRAADGSMRDALSLTDQAIAHGAGQVTEAEVNAMLGTIDRGAVVAICQAIADRNADAALASTGQMAEHSPDYSSALAEMLSLWHRVAIAQTAPDALDHSHGDHSDVLALAEQLSREDVQLFYQITLLGRRDLPHAADPRSGFEMVLLRLLAFQPVLPEQAESDPPLRQVAPAEEVAAPAKKPEPMPPPAPPVADTPMADSPIADTGPAPEPPPPESSAPDTEPGPGATVAGSDMASGRQGHTTPAPVAEVVPPNLEEVPAQSGDEETISWQALTPDNWIQLYRSLDVGGLLQNTAANLVLREKTEQGLKFVLDSDNSSLYDESQQERLAAVLTAHFDRPVQVEIGIDQVDAETPLANAQRLRAERQQAAVASLHRDPAVKSIVETFDGQLLEDTVQPLD